MNRDKRKRYAANWELISSRIKFERAKNSCEKCGVHNNLFIKRKEKGAYDVVTGDVDMWVKKLMFRKQLKYFSALKVLGITRVVLTVAHLNHDEMDNRDTNLLCLCQRCHLMHDKQNNFFRAIKYKHDKNQLNLF